MGKNNIPEIKKQILSIISEGNRSGLINDFVYECTILANAYLLSKVNKNIRDKIIEEYGFSDETDLAIDCIADLFEVKEGFYFQINDFFKFENFNPEEAEPELIFSKLRCLIWSAVSLRVYELYDPFYVKIRKSINICFDRVHNYKKALIGEKIFLYRRNEDNQNRPSLTSDLITEVLLDSKITNHTIPQLVETVFNFLDLQSEYSNQVELNELTKGIIDYYKRRIINQFDDEEQGHFISTKSEFREAFEHNLNKYLQKKKHNFKRILYNSVIYIFTCLKSELNFKLNSVPSSELLLFLFNSKLQDFDIQCVLITLFDYINSREDILKAVKFKILSLILSDFYLTFKDL